MPKRHRPGRTASEIVSHIEEIVLATSGEDAFELVFAVAAARMAGRGRTFAERVRSLPALLEVRPPEASPALIARVDELLVVDEVFGALDAVFESLVPRLAKGDKGQFFTPRPVVDFVIDMLGPRANEVVIDPACGSGAFLAHARANARVETYGCDVDRRAVRVARLLAVAQGRDPEHILLGDGLHRELPKAQVVATNPPFAGRAPSDGFEVGSLVRTPERDVLFLERALDLLEPGGRLGIVLPYNKAAGTAFAKLRRWLLEKARVLAVIGLPQETFEPHTTQRTFVMFAQKRKTKASANETIFFNTADDLDATAVALAPFLEAQGFSSPRPKRAGREARTRIETVDRLGEHTVLAPERHLRAKGEGIALGDLCKERGERARDLEKAIVLDTTHVKDGLVDLRAALRDGAGTLSSKKRACPGDLLISRLRPYLRQIAIVPPLDRELAVSSEFYVLTGDSLEWLLPVLLGNEAQAALASAQEGGHHPRVPRSSLLSLPIPHAAVANKSESSKSVRRSLAAYYRALSSLDF